jgi:hypothetical protein
MNKHKVLIIAYYWPPAGGAGVQRWLKFVKYLRDFGWEPIVYTAENGEVPVLDNTLQKDVPAGVTVLKQPILEPYSLYKKFVGQKKDEKINAGFLSESKKNPALEKISVFIRGNLFIPDARMLWINPSIRFLTDYLKENPVDAIVSTGPPHSMHLIAMGLKKALNLPWLADFRDPWTNIDYYDQLMLTSWANRKHRKLEKQVIDTCDGLLVISEGMRKEFLGLGAKNPIVLTNGYDAEDFNTSFIPSGKFTLSHIGSMNKDRNSPMLWDVLEELCNEEQAFKADFLLQLVGKNDVEVSQRLGSSTIPVSFVAYLPHQEVVKYTAQSELLLLPLNNTPNARDILTGKLFEYLAAARPILCIGPTDGDCAKILAETGNGTTIDFKDKPGLKKAIWNFYLAYKANQLKVEGRGVSRYSRKSLTESLAKNLTSIIKK